MQLFPTRVHFLKRNLLEIYQNVTNLNTRQKVLLNNKITAAEEQEVAARVHRVLLI